MKKQHNLANNLGSQLVAALLAFAFFPIAFFPIALVAQDTAVQPDVDVPDQQEFDTAIHVESFDVVWDTIKKTHWDKELVGESWDAAKEKFRPQVETAEDADEVREAINEMLATLEMSHFGIISNEAYDEYTEEMSADEDDTEEMSDDTNDTNDTDETEKDDEPVEEGEGTAGLEIRLVEDKLVVTRVFENSAGSAAGVEPGWIVKLIGKRTADELLKAAKVVGEHSVVRKNTAVGLVCDNRTAGDIGDEMAFAFVDNDGKVQLKQLELTRAPGKEETFGNLPPFNVNFESKELEDGIGYIAFNSFLGGPRLNREYQQAIKDYRDKNGLIIDLRGNRGGMVILVSAMCGWLATEKESIGKMSMSGGNEMNLVLNPRRPRWDKPVAILTDECSISAAEIMAGGIKDLKLGRVFGSTTAGLSLPSTVIKLPNGDGFQFAVSAYYSASGDSIEGTGVVPDEEIVLTRKMLSNSPDPVLSAAKKWILEEGKE